MGDGKFYVGGLGGRWVVLFRDFYTLSIYHLPAVYDITRANDLIT